ncbi:MAG TPA: hypothetical protein GXX23_02685 [Firmicutes bacterium]|nr:hypothetical protein [Candidatus Fermentithermobacillaceae bacterium]
MKLLITGDWHYRSQNPVARLDDFQATLNAKLHEVGQIAYDYDVEAIIVPGDIFDSPNPAYSTLTALERIIKDNGRQVWAVPGNHDEHAHSLESLDRTAYGHLAATGMIRDLAMRPVVTGIVTVTGTGFSTTTDTDVSDYLTKNTSNATQGCVRIHVAHGMLLERSPGFELKHTLLEDVAKHPRCPDILVCGHEHLGFGVKRLPRAAGGEVVFINPGAVVRLSAHPGEMERTVQVCLLEVYPGTLPECHSCGVALLPENASSLQDGDEYIVTCPKCGNHSVVHYAGWGPPEVWSIGSPVVDTTLIPLKSARPGHEVLSRDHLEAQADREAKMGQFLNLLSREGEAKFLDVQSIVEGIAKSENLPREVVDEALSRIAKAREALGGRGRTA